MSWFQKFDGENPAHVQLMRRIARRMAVPHGVGTAQGRVPGDADQPEAADAGPGDNPPVTRNPLPWKKPPG